MTLSLSKLKAVADKATDGDWRTSLPDATLVVSDLFDIASACSERDDYDADYERLEANAAHIATFDPPTVKRLLAIAKAGSDALPLLEALAIVFEQSPIASFAPKTTAKMAADIRKQYDALSAALEGVEL